jgi:hypothetical protein
VKLDAIPSPDLLRRFVATPYVFTDNVGPSRHSVRSNELGIALAVRRSWSTHRAENLPTVVSWHLIRDVFAANTSTEMTLVSAGKLRTLIVGTETILCYDAQRSECLGFVSSRTTIPRLFAELIPVLLKI